ncbi:MAG: hypothetical protein NWE93_14490 [Candidatus Bathyarchaeota archaeon]|nr:hypothetical protein [Candidatus Bathyarchaeota archaeon]
MEQQRSEVHADDLLEDTATTNMELKPLAESKKQPSAKPPGDDEYRQFLPSSNSEKYVINQTTRYCA